MVRNGIRYWGPLFFIYLKGRLFNAEAFKLLLCAMRRTFWRFYHFSDLFNCIRFDPFVINLFPPHVELWNCWGCFLQDRFKHSVTQTCAGAKVQSYSYRAECPACVCVCVCFRFKPFLINWSLIDLTSSVQTRACVSVVSDTVSVCVSSWAVLISPSIMYKGYKGDP